MAGVRVHRGEEAVSDLVEFLAGLFFVCVVVVSIVATFDLTMWQSAAVGLTCGILVPSILRAGWRAR